MRFKELNIEKLLDYQKLKDTRQKTKDKTKNREMQHSQQPLEENNKLKNRRIQMKKSLIVTMFIMLIMMISAISGVTQAATYNYQIGTTKYTTLQAAFNAATDGSRITVLGNYEDASNAVLSGGKSVTLFCNGYTLTKTTYPITVNSSKLKVVGTGKISGQIETINTGSTILIAQDIGDASGGSLELYLGAGYDIVNYLVSITPTVSMTGYTYGGTKTTPTIRGNTGNGTVTYYYNTTNSNIGGTPWKNVTSSTSLTPGTYYMYAEVMETETYNCATTAPVAFTIGKRTATTPSGVNKAYTGSAQNLVAGGESAVTWYYSTETPLTISNYSRVGSTTRPQGIDIGTYTIYYYTPGNSIYSATSGSLYTTATIRRATGSVTASISGTVAIGQTLTATGTTSSDGTKSYQWYRASSQGATSGTNISGAKSSTYTLTSSDAGYYIGVKVSVAQGTIYTSCNDTETTTTTVGRATGSVTASISGTPTVGQTLTATGTTSSNGTKSYQWYRTSTKGATSGTNISGATSSTYKLTSSDIGYYIGVIVSVSQGTSYTACSDTETTTSTVGKIQVGAPTNISVSNTGIVTWTAGANSTGHQISIDGSTWTTATNGVNYNSTITAATGSRTVYVRAVNSDTTTYSSPSSSATKTVTVYKLTLNKGTGISSVSGAGNYISGRSVSISATPSSGYTFSSWTKSSGNSPANTTAANTTVTVSATTTLTANATSSALTFNAQSKNATYSTSSQTITITGASNGTGTYTYSEVSEKNGSGTATSYFTISGTTITVKASTPAGTYTYTVRATDSSSGLTKDADITITINRTTGSVTASISGTPTVGQTLTATGTTASDGTKSYQWYRASSQGATGGTSISGATSSTYTLTSSDVGYYIGVIISVAQGTNHAACNDAETTTLKVTASSLAFDTQTLTSGTYNTSYSKSFTAASGGSGSYTYTVNSVTCGGTVVTASSGKYNGLSLSGTTISGTPTQAGTYVFSIKATDSSSGATKDAEITIVIRKKTNTLTVTANSLMYTGNAQSLVTVSGAQGTVYYAVGTQLTSSNYSSSGSPTIPTRTDVGTYKVYYYTPGNTNYNSRSGNVSATISELVVPTLMAETYSNAYTNKYILGNSTSGIKRNQVNAITIETSIPANISSYTNWDVSDAGNGSVMAYLVPNGTSSGTQMYHLHISGNGGNVKATSGQYLFAYYENCTSITGLDKLDTSAVTTMSNMFSTCSSLTSIDVSSFNTSAVTDSMGHMFYGCSSLTSLDVSNFNTSSVTSMNSMFNSCSNLTSLDVSRFNTSSVTSMNYMFGYCSSLTSLDVSRFNTSSVTNMSGMFRACSSLTSLDVSNFNTSSVTAMISMFNSCSNLTSLDVSSFNTSAVPDTGYMFDFCKSLTNIYIGENFDKINGKNMFSNTSKLASIISIRTTPMTVTDSEGAVVDNGLNTSNTKAVIYIPNATVEGNYEADSNYASLLGFTANTDSPRIEPVLGLYGNETVTINVGGTYEEAATVAGFKSVTGTDITPTEVKNYGYALTQTSNNVNLSTPGNYTVTYRLTLNGTEVDTITRNVKVTSSNYSVNGTYYETLKEAVAAIDTTGTIIVEKDYTDSSSVTIPSEKNITIDTNGKTITKVSAGSLYGITNNGNLTIVGEGTIQTDIVDNNKIAILIQNNGTITVKSGNLINKGCIGSHFRTIQGGDINIEGGVIKACVEGTKTTTGNPRTVNIENGTLNITGGEIIADGKPLAFAVESYANSSEFNGTINFSDGKINSSGYGIVILGKKPDHLLLNMTGGEINSVEVGVYGGGNSVGAIAIKDGTIISENNCGVYNEGTATCTIGTDDTNVSATNPIIIGATEAVVSTNGFTFYDGIAKGADKAVTVESVNEIPEGYEVVNGTERINGVDYDVAYLKLTPTFAVEPTSLELKKGETGTITITYDGDGEINAVAEDGSVATVSISENIISVIGENEGTTTVTVSAAESDEYAPKSATFTVTVKLVSIDTAKVSLSQTLYAYDSAAKEPVVTVTLDGKVLVKDTDYTVRYQNNVEIGTATVVITGINTYKGTAKEYFVISSNTTENDQIIVDLQAPTISNVVGIVDGSKVTVTATIEDPIITETIPGRGVNTSETRYAITDTATAPTADSAAWQSSNVFTISDVSTVYLWIKAVDNVGNVSISTELSNVKVTKDISDLEVSLSETKYTYDGNAKTPTVTVKDGDIKLTLDTDYTVSYKNNVNAGTATVTVTGKGYYTGSVDVTFTIEKADATLTLDPTSVSVKPGTSATVVITYTGDGVVNVSSASDSIATATKVGNTITITGVAAGTTSVTVSVSGEKNYNSVANQTVTVYVQATPTIPTITVTNANGTVASGDWSNKELSITISGSTITGPGEIGYKYSYDGNVWYEYNGVVAYTTDTKDGVIYAKAYNKSEPTLESDRTSYDIRLDKTAPTGVTIETSATTSTVTLNVTNVNANVSGLKEYEFYLDGALKATQTGSSYTFTGLSAGVTYTVGVKVRDNAGNVTDLVSKSQTTNAVSGEIVLTPDKTAWTNTDVIVTIEWPNTTLIKQIKVGNGEWQNYSDTSYTITENITIYARLTDGTNHGSAVSLAIENIDKNTPTVTAQSSVVYGNTVTLTIADALSGVDGWQVTESDTAPTSGWTTIAPATNTTVTYKPTKVDTYYAWVKDQAGNVSAYAMFEVTAKDLSTSSDITAELNEKVFTYDGTAKTPSATVKDGTTELKAGTDYDITYINNTNAGTATATIAGKGNYKGTITLNFTINKATSVLTLNPTSGKTSFSEENSFSVKSNADGNIKVTSGNVTYVEIVSGDDANLLAETPSSVTYRGAKATKTPVTITVAFTPTDTINYTTATATYTVTEVSKSEPTLVANPDSVTVTVGSSEKVTITYDGDGTITATPKDGSVVTVDKSTNEITVTGVKNGKTEIEVTVSEGTNHESKTITIPVTVVSKSISSSDVKASLNETTYTYDGNAKTPTVTIVDETRGKTLLENTDYTVSYQNNIEAGTATVVITGKGDYAGTITLPFTINQAPASLTVSPETLNITVGGNGTSIITYVGDGTVSAIPASTAIANVSKNGDTITVSGVSVGTTTVTVSATAGKNYTAPVNKTITVNVCAAPTTAPTITVKNSDGVVASGDWSNKDLTITISGSSITGAGEVGYKYSYDGITWYEYTSAITYATEIKDGVIYAKAYNKLIDTLESANATYAINVDKTAPKNVVLETSATTNTVILEVSSVDGSISGVKEYEFYLNGELKATQTFASYTFAGLNAESNYTVGVKVRDNAGNVTELTTSSVTTEAVSGTITLTPDKTTWTNTDVIVTIGWPNSTLTKQIKVGNGNWQNYSESTYTITENTTISARLSDGTNHGDAASLEIDNIDKEDPRVSLGTNTYVYGTSLNLSMQDSLSGVNAYVITETSEEPATGWNTISVIKNGSLGIGKYSAGKHFIWVKDQAGNVSDYFEVTITAKDLSSTDITAELDEKIFTYDGAQKTPTATVVDGSVKLNEEIDYIISYNNNINAGTATATITGVGNYAGMVTRDFTIEKANIKPTVNMRDYIYGETVSIPSVNDNIENGTITYYYNTTNSTSGGTEWKNITPTALDVGTYYMYAIIDGTANYNGATTPTKVFKVVAKSISSNNITITIQEEPGGYIYDGTPKTPEVIVKDGILELTEESDYTVEYKNNIDAGTATVTVTGIGNYAGSIDKTFIIAPAIPTITLKDKEANYTGSPIHIDEAIVVGQPAGDEPDGEITYTYYIDAECTTLTNVANSGATTNGGAPVDVGTYYVRATIAALGNYTENTSATAKLTIIGAPTTPVITIKESTNKIITEGEWATTTVTVTIGESELLGDGNIKYQYNIDNGAWIEYTGPFVYDIETKGTTISARAYNEIAEIMVSDVVERTIKLDKTAPTDLIITAVTEEGIYENGWINKNVSATFTAIDSISEISHYLYSVNNGEWITGNNVSFDYSDEFVLEVKAINNAGLECQAVEKLIKLDKDVPEVTSVTASGIIGRTEEITVLANDVHSGVEKYALTKSDAAPDAYDTVVWQDSNIFNVTENATWYAWAMDGAGNISAKTENSVVTNSSVDRNPIKIEASIYTTNTSGRYAKVGDTITLRLKTNKVIGVLPTVTIAGETAILSDTQPGKKEYTANIVVSDTTPEGTVEFLITGYADEIGNEGIDVTETIDNTIVYVDRTLPTTTKPEVLNITENSIVVQSNQKDIASNVFNSGIVQTEYAFKESTQDNWSGWQTSETLERLALGTSYDIMTRATDAAGNISTSEVLTNVMTVIVTAGDIELVPDYTEWVNTDVTVTIYWPETTLNKYYREDDGEWQVVDASATQTKVVVENYGGVVTAKLADGNVNEITNSITIFNIDKIKPTLEATVQDKWTNTPKLIGVTSDDADPTSGIAGYYLTTDKDYVPTFNEFVVNESYVQTYTKEMGTYYIWVVDNAKNICENPAEVVVKNIEKEKPVITLVGVSDNIISKGDSIIITFKATDNNTDMTTILETYDIEIFVGNNIVIPTVNTLTTTNKGNEIIYELTLGGLTGDGEVSVVIPSDRVTDIAGNTNDETTLTTNVIVDNSAPEKPVVTVTPEGEVVGGDVTITITPVPGEDYEYSTDGGETWQEVPDDNKIIIDEEGDTEVLIKATDEAGNESEETEVNVRIDITDPVLDEENIILPEDEDGNTKDNVKEGDTIIIEIPITDENDVILNPDKVIITVGGEEITPDDITLETEPGTGKPTITITIVVDENVEGDVIVEIEEGAITDVAGNEVAPEIIETGVKVDNTKPVVTITPPEGEYKSGDEITYVIEITEENSYEINEEDLEVEGGVIKDVIVNDDGTVEVIVIVGDGDGNVTIIVEEGFVTDAAGNTNDIVSDTTVIVDNTPPVLNGATINNGSAVTDGVGVTVQIDAIDANWMFITNENVTLSDVTNLPKDAWTPYANETLHELTQGDGEKTVYVWVKDNAGNIIGPATPSITLNATTIGNKEDKVVENGIETTTSTGNNNTVVKFKVTDENFYNSVIESGMIVAFVNGSQCFTATFENVDGSAITNGVAYQTIVTNVSGNGRLSLGLEGATVRDKAGNVLSTTEKPVDTQIIADNSAPTLTVTTNEITVNDTNIVGVTLNGKLITTTNGTTTINVPAGSVVKAIDKAGNTTTVIK